MTEKPACVAIYARLSKNRNGESESVERQVASCRAYVKAHDWPEVPDALVFKDDDISAFSGKRRPGLDNLWSAVDTGSIDAVVVWKLDRLTRRFSDAYKFLPRLRDYGSALVSVSESLDATTPMGEAMIGVLIAIAETESLNTSLRQTAYQAGAAAKGKAHGGGQRTFGYTQTKRDSDGNVTVRANQVIPEEAIFTKEAVHRLTEGDSLRSVAKWLNESGCLTTAGKPWSGNTLKQYVESPKIAGIRTYNGATTPGDWEPIISVAEREALLLRFTKLGGPRGTNVKRNLLTGLAICGKCTANLYVHHQRYWCEKCRGISIVGPKFEEYVTDQALSFLAGAKLKLMHDIVSLPAMRAELEADQAALVELNRDRYVRRTLNENDWAPIHADLTERIAGGTAALRAAEQAQTDGPLQPGSRPDLEAWWKSANIEDRRAAMRSTLSAVIVQPATRRGAGLDLSRVMIVFRFDRYVEADIEAGHKEALEAWLEEPLEAWLQSGGSDSFKNAFKLDAGVE